MKKFLLAIAVLAGLSAAAQTFAVGDLNYTITGTATVEVSGLANTTVTAIDVPASVDASGVTLREEDPENGFVIEPMSEWVANISSDKMSVNLWGSDYDGYTDYFFARDIAYYLTIPAGAITTGRAVNEEAIVITYYGAEPTTGIDNVNAKGATEVARYNINGQRVTAGQTGVVIVKMSDGSSVKMIVR